MRNDLPKVFSPVVTRVLGMPSHVTLVVGCLVGATGRLLVYLYVSSLEDFMLYYIPAIIGVGLLYVSVTLLKKVLSTLKHF